ncbi:zinc-dependent alcohol dehydrogenase [Pseudodonghicola xiamenensis]|uniref:Dehydrogenase n=1 Tax=Pseudodonghicola xiamenensis TaxID=337702 RepID=A0A8J3H769_9RHOB|nr:alcohol dehydrogenase catalytic domain-containing protein [Pseudodonghicola xiamenensis]GHG86212.1 dehydrogenase [Pseudodonghicola xiamenensis]
MRAVRLYGVEDLRVEDIAPPAPPAADEVSLSLTAAGICGSDLHNFRTGAWISRAPSVAGHEFTGVVTACGAGVAHVSPGDRVIVDSRYLCGECPACRDGLGQVCENLGFLGEIIDGGFAEAVTLPARNLLRAPGGVADRHLAMAEPLAVALHALRRLSAPQGAVIAITGCGPIGGLAALLARRAGHPVQVIDRNAARASLVSAATGAEIATLEDLPVQRLHHAIETTGNATVIGALIAVVAGASSIALVGIGAALPSVDAVTLVEREISLLGCHAFTDRDLADIRDMLPELAGALDAFIAEEIGLDEVPDAYRRHIGAEVAGLKTIIRCQEG